MEIQSQKNFCVVYENVFSWIKMIIKNVNIGRLEDVGGMFDKTSMHELVSSSL